MEAIKEETPQDLTADKGVNKQQRPTDPAQKWPTPKETVNASNSFASILKNAPTSPNTPVKEMKKLNVSTVIRKEFEHRLNGTDEKTPVALPKGEDPPALNPRCANLKNLDSKEKENASRDDRDSVRYDLIYNPQCMIYGSFRKFPLQERIIKIRDLERHYYMRNQQEFYHVDRDVHIPAAGTCEASLKNGRNYIYRMLTDYECVLFSKLHWNVFDFVYPMKCKYVMMSKYSQNRCLTAELQPFLALCPTASYPNFVFCCFLDDPIIPVYD